MEDRPAVNVDVGAILDAPVRESLPYVTNGLSILFILFAFSTPAFIAAPASLWLTSSLGATAGVFYVLRRWFLRQPVWNGWGHFAAGTIVAFVLLNCIIPMSLLGSPRQTTNFLLLIIGCGCFLLSFRWLAGIVGLIIASWELLAWTQFPPSQWAGYHAPVISAAALAFVIREVRARNCLHREISKQHDCDRLQELEAAVVSLEREISERKSSEAALQDSEQRYRQLVDLCPVMMGVHADGKFVYVNAAGADLLGAAGPDSLVGKPVFDFAHPDDRERVLQQISALHHSEGPPTVVEQRVVRLDGGVMDVEVVSKPISLSGRPAIQMLARDIGQRKIHEQKQRFRITFESLVRQICTQVIKLPAHEFATDVGQALETLGQFTGADRCQLILFANENMLVGSSLEWCRDGVARRTERLRGASLATGFPWFAEQLQRQRVIEVTSIAELPPQALADARLLNEQGVQSLIMAPMSSTGSVSGFLGLDWSRPREKWDDEHLTLLQIVAEVFGHALHHHRIEAEVRAKEALFRGLVEQSLVGIDIVQDGKLQYVNPRLAEMVGYAPAEMLAASSVLDLVVEEDRSTVESKIRQRMEGKAESQVYRMRARHKNGSIVHCEVHGSRTEYNGRPAVIATVVDVTNRVHMEQAVQASEARFRTLFDEAGIGIALVDRNGRVLDTNPALQNMVAATAEVLHQENFAFASLIHPEARASLLALVEQTFGGERTTFQAETQIVRQGGDALWARLTTALLRNAGGEPDAVIVMVEDVSKQKRAMEELRSSEEKWRTLVENAPDVIAILDPDGTISFANRSPAGAEPESTIGRPADELLPETARAEFQRQLEQVSKTGVTASFDVCFLDENEQPRWYSSRIGAIHDSERRIVALMSISTDITDRKRMEDSFRESEARLKAIIETAPDAIITTDECGVIESVNPAGESIFGYTASEAKGLNINAWIDGSDSVGPSDFLTMCPETGIMRMSDTRRHVQGRRKDGTDFPMDLSVSEVQFDARTRFALIARDNSERKQLEERLRHSQKMEAIGTLAGGIAHDFNNILAAILGYTELAMGMQPVGGKAYQNLQQVFRAGQRASSLVQQILAFSRKQDARQQPVQVALIALELIQLLRPTLPSTIEIKSDIDDDSGLVLADPTQIHQLMMNLCTNAAHAMAAHGGVLRVEVGNVAFTSPWRAKNVELPAGRYVRIAVSDSGVGISGEILPRIFEPYFTTKEPGTGTGMGLAVVHGIVDVLEGGISVASTPTEGTTFEVLLPSAGGRPISGPAEADDNLPAGNECILCIDDEDGIVDMTQQALESLGYAVVTAKSSTEALESFRSDPQRFDLIITDQTMPNMTGLALAQQMRTIRPDIPIILTTGHSDAVNAEVIEEFGINQFLQKPIDVRQLAIGIRRALDVVSPAID